MFDVFSLIVITILIIGVLIVLTPIVIIIYGILKKKRKLVIITLILTSSVLLFLITYNNLYPTQYPYIDSWIIGRNRQEIEAKYSEPDIIRDPFICYYIGKDNGFFGDLSSNDDFYYYIYFDDDGKACRVKKSIQLGG